MQNIQKNSQIKMQDQPKGNELCKPKSNKKPHNKEEDKSHT